MIKVINTGGTFNKVYDAVAGRLVVAQDDVAVESALASLSAGVDIEISGIIYKDSLDFEDTDRDRLCEEIDRTDRTQIVVVHGTDTMNRSAAAVASSFSEKSGKRVVFTGAMVPFSIDPVEATTNIVLALTSISYLSPGIYIAMHGLVLPYNEIEKDRERGVFIRVGDGV